MYVLIKNYIFGVLFDSHSRYVYVCVMEPVGNKQRKITRYGIPEVMLLCLSIGKQQILRLNIWHCRRLGNMSVVFVT